jgi:hypothetical protein
MPETQGDIGEGLEVPRSRFQFPETGPETQSLPKGVLYFEGPTFNAWIAPSSGLEIVPGRELSYPRGEKSPKSILTKAQYEELIRIYRQEVDYSLEGADLSLELLKLRKNLSEKYGDYARIVMTAVSAGAITKEEADQRLTPVPADERRGFFTPSERNKYTAALTSTQKVSLRNFHFQTNEQGNPVLVTDYIRKGVPFAFYKTLRSPDLAPDILDLAMPTATAMVLMTSDNKLALQLRSKHNALYKETLGASAAGMWNVTRDEKGNVQTPTAELARANILKEIDEELGLQEKDFSLLSIGGVARDKVSVHTEVLFLGKLNIPAREVRLRANENARQERPIFDFSEDFVLIDASSETVDALLTEAKCHIPSTHAAALTALAAHLKREELEREGLGGDVMEREMARYLQDLQERTQRNYLAIDEMVRIFWSRDPRREMSGYKLPKEPRKYDPGLTPEEQGLPPLRQELMRLGLLYQEKEK